MRCKNQKNKKSSLNFKSQFTTSSFDRRLEPAHTPTPMVRRHVNRHDAHSVCVHSSMDWTSWLLTLDVTVHEGQKGHTR